MEFRGTTICAVKKDGITAIAGDGQVTMGVQQAPAADAQSQDTNQYQGENAKAF